MRYVRLFLVLLVLLVASPAWGSSGWKFTTPMPHGRYWHDATLGKDGKIYVMGGMVVKILKDRMLYRIGDGRYSNLVYDPDKGTWKYLTPVIGWQYVNGYYYYNPSRDMWERVDYKHGMEIPPDARRSDIGREGDGVRIVTTKEGKIFWIGGQGRSHGHGESTVLPYHPEKDAWPEVGYERIYFSKTATSSSFGDNLVIKTDIPAMQERRIDHEAVITSEGKIYVMGGYKVELVKRGNGDPIPEYRHEASNTMECYDPQSNRWEYKKSLSSKRMWHAAVVSPDDKIYVFGGAAGMADQSATLFLDTVEIYDPKTDSWASGTPMPSPRASHAAVLGSDGKIFIMGGVGAVHGPPLKDVFVYDPMKDTWQKGPGMKIPRSCLAAVATPGGKIYAIGGTDVGAYGGSESLNTLIPRKGHLYTGRVQETVEVLDISK